MGVEQVTTWTCDIGGEQTIDPVGWVTFTLSAMPVSMADTGPAAISFGSTTNVVCPDHVEQVEEIIVAGLTAIKTPPTPEPAPEPAPAPSG